MINMSTTNVVERAIELGYSKREIGDGRILGSFVKSFVTPLNFKSHYNGFMVLTYKRGQQLDDAIHQYFKLVSGENVTQIDLTSW